MENMLVNAREQRRVILLTQVVGGALTVAGAAERLALSERQTKRLLAGFRREGVAGVTPSRWTVKHYATKPSVVHLLSYASGDK